MRALPSQGSWYVGKVRWEKHSFLLDLAADAVTGGLENRLLFSYCPIKEELEKELRNTFRSKKKCPFLTFSLFGRVQPPQEKSELEEKEVGTYMRHPVGSVPLSGITS